MRVDVFGVDEVKPTGVEQGVISIQTPQTYYGRLVDYLSLAFKEVKVLKFDDIRRKTCNSDVLPNIVHAREILDFALNWDSLVVHCDMGLSRSVAVGAFLRDYYGAKVTFHTSGRDDRKNPLLYELLEEANREKAPGHVRPLQLHLPPRTIRRRPFNRGSSLDD
jgi:hypothetical protein